MGNFSWGRWIVFIPPHHLLYFTDFPAISILITMKLNIALCILCIAAPLTAGAADTESIYCLNDRYEIRYDSYGNIIDPPNFNDFDIIQQLGDEYFCTNGTPAAPYLHCIDDRQAYMVYPCECNQGFKPTPSPIGVCKNQTYISGCECVCSNCNSTDWTAAGKEGYETQIRANCNCSGGTAQCNKETKYRCASGWYGTTNDGKTGCSKCPANATCNGGYSKFSCNQGYYEKDNGCTKCPTDPGGVQGTTSGTGATSISACFIAKDTTNSNLQNGYHGQYTYVDTCKATQP